MLVLIVFGFKLWNWGWRNKFIFCIFFWNEYC